MCSERQGLLGDTVTSHHLLSAERVCGAALGAGLCWARLELVPLQSLPNKASSAAGPGTEQTSASALRADGARHCVPPRSLSVLTLLCDDDKCGHLFLLLNKGLISSINEPKK